MTIRKVIKGMEILIRIVNFKRWKLFGLVSSNHIFWQLGRLRLDIFEYDPYAGADL